jgi:hypothetical protein
MAARYRRRRSSATRGRRRSYASLPIRMCVVAYPAPARRIFAATPEKRQFYDVNPIDADVGNSGCKLCTRLRCVLHRGDLFECAVEMKTRAIRSRRSRGPLSAEDTRHWEYLRGY